MRKKHPIRRLFLLLLMAAIVAGLAALPLLTKNAGKEENTASILAAVPQRQALTPFLSYGAPLSAVEPTAVSVPDGVKVLEYLVANGDSVKAGDPIARVDDVSVMTAVKSAQEALDSVAASMQALRSKIDPGIITVSEEGDLLVNGKKIDTEKLTSYTQFLNYAQKHRKYEELLLDLFILHQDGVVKASCDGIVGEIDKDQILKLSAGQGGRVMLLAKNIPNGEEEDEYSYRYSAMRIIDIIGGKWFCQIGTVNTDTDDLAALSSSHISFVDADGNDNEVRDMEPLFDRAYYHENGQWTQVTPEKGGIYVSADAIIEEPSEDSAGVSWVIKVGTSSVAPGQEPADGKDPLQGLDGLSGQGQRGRDISGIDVGSLLGGLRSRGGAGSGNASQEPELYSTEKTQLCTVTPMETMSLILPVDEMDVAKLTVGMTADVTFEALPNRQFTAQITEISQFGTNAGGSSKFDVTLELPCAEGMLPGMNANVILKLDTVPDCLTVPVAALAEQGSKTVIYTAIDEQTGEMTNPVPVTTGLSDGQHVQILSGLQEGASFWYSYYDTLEISTAVETRGMFG